MAASKSIKKAATEPKRCAWARNELAIRYHDEEWGVPVHDDRRLFEFFFVLEGAQGWAKLGHILKKARELSFGFRRIDAGMHRALPAA